jgi:hypothetical protein
MPQRLEDLHQLGMNKFIAADHVLVFERVLVAPMPLMMPPAPGHPMTRRISPRSCLARGLFIAAAKASCQFATEGSQSNLSTSGTSWF